MKKIFLIYQITFCFILIIFICPKIVFADSIPNIGIIISDPKHLRSVMINGFLWPSEISPIILLNPNGQKIYINPGSISNICLSSDNLLQTNVVLPQANCLINATVASIFSGLDNQGNIMWKNPSAVLNQPWKYSYDGIFGASVLPGQNRVFFAKTFEDQDYVNRYAVTGARECSDPSKSWVYTGGSMHPDTGSRYCTCDQQDTNCPDTTNPLCVAGNNKCPADLSDANHDHSWPTFTSGITMGWTDYLPGSGWQKNEVYDEGPIVWPNPAYRTNGRRTPGINGGGGYAIPIVWNDFIYLFYQMDRLDQAQCTQLARAPVSSNGMPGNWKNYYNGSFSENSLPAGFDKGKIADYYEIPGGKADCILTDARNDAATWFSVAKINGTDYFIAAEESSPNYSSYKMGVRYSKDLVHWSSLQVIETAQTKFGDGNYTYTRFLNKDGTSNTEIDTDEFYVYGKKTGTSLGGPYIIQSLKLSLVFKPPADKIDPLIRQYFQQFLKRDSPDPSAWHENIMNQSGCKGVISDFVYGPEFTQGYKKTATNEEYITMLYRAILSRDPDSNGMSYYLNKLNTGVSRDAIADEIMSGQEANDACVAGRLFTLPGDLNSSGKVDIFDYNLMIQNFGNTTCGNMADIDGNCRVDIFDYNTLIQNFGKTQ